VMVIDLTLLALSSHHAHQARHAHHARTPHSHRLPFPPSYISLHDKEREKNQLQHLSSTMPSPWPLRAKLGRRKMRLVALNLSSEVIEPGASTSTPRTPSSTSGRRFSLIKLAASGHPPPSLTTDPNSPSHLRVAFLLIRVFPHVHLFFAPPTGPPLARRESPSLTSLPSTSVPSKAGNEPPSLTHPPRCLHGDSPRVHTEATHHRKIPHAQGCAAPARAEAAARTTTARYRARQHT
jgi:hypothetical protein